MKKMFYSLSCILLLLILASNLYADSSGIKITQNEGKARNYYTAPYDLWFYDNVHAVSRYREAVLADELLLYGLAGKGDRLLLNLFDDREYTAVIDRIEVNINGTLAIRARLEGYVNSCFIISTTQGRSLGEVEIPEKGERYIITSDPESGIHYLMEMDKREMNYLQNSPALIPPVMSHYEKQSESSGEKDPGPNDPATIDIMLVYTPAASSWASTNEGGISNTISQTMQKAQLTLDNSLTGITATLVHSAQVSYTESGSSNTDLDRLTNTSDGYMDDVHTWRNTYAADVVGLFTQVEDTGGLGWLLNTTDGLPDYAFSISRVQQVSWTYTFIHEAGHNMGTHHHKQQNVQPGPGLFSYSAGWRWVGNDAGRYCSVMTYESGTYFADGYTHYRVAYFSNPSVSYQGVSTGHSTDGDNARNLREIKHVIAAYRSAITVPDAPSGLSALAVSQSQIDLYWTDNSDNEDGFKIERKTGSGGTWSQITTVSADNTYYSSTGLNYNTSYYYRVRAYNSAGDSSYSNEADDTTFDIPPLPPASLFSFPFSGTRIDLSWTDVSGNETGFAVERKAGIAGTWAEITTLPANTTFYSDTGLTPVTTYFYRASAYNDYGISPYSNETSSSTLVLHPLGDSLDSAELPWITSGSVGYTFWHGQDDDWYYGGSAGRAGCISHNETTGAGVYVDGPGELSFYWKVSSEENADWLVFYINGIPQNQISGQIDWTQMVYSLEPGGYNLEWVYEKNPAVSSYNDTAYLDYVSFVPEYPCEDAAISLENESVKGIYTWSYSDSKQEGQILKGSSWNKIFNGVTASKIETGDITGDGIPEIVALIPGSGLYYYNMGTSSWSCITALSILDFTLARTSTDPKKQAIVSIDGYGLYKYNIDTSSWSVIIQYPAELVCALNLDRDAGMIDELAVAFQGINRLYIYDFTLSSFSTILMAKPSQVISADVTFDQNAEMICVFDGIGVYMVRYLPEKNLLLEAEKTMAEKYPLFLLDNIKDDHVWNPKNSKGLQWNRITYATPDTGHKVAAGDITGDCGAEVFTCFAGKVSYYTYSTSSWTNLINSSFKRILAGKFTGGAKDDLIMCATSSGDIYLRKTSTGSYELISSGGDTNAMAVIR